jgi:hypothetical protein
MRGVDAKDLALKVSPAEVDNPTHSDTQDKAAAVIRLLSAVGSYKAERWQGTDQLRAAAETLEMWAGVPGFDPAQAGLDETRFATAKALAALEADTLTKPHYQYSHRERALFASALNEVLDHLDRAEARYLLHVATGHITV